jgi:UDP-N-acetylmuramyl pentapeptide synthase
MLELGRQTDSLHKEIGMFCAASGIEKLFLTGSFAETVAEEARKNGMNRSNICIAGKEEILAELKRILQAGDWVLIKGSRGMKMEVIPEGLKEEDKEEFSIKTG